MLSDDCFLQLPCTLSGHNFHYFTLACHAVHGLELIQQHPCGCRFRTCMGWTRFLPLAGVFVYCLKMPCHLWFPNVSSHFEGGSESVCTRFLPLHCVCIVLGCTLWGVPLSSCGCKSSPMYIDFQNLRPCREYQWKKWYKLGTGSWLFSKNVNPKIKDLQNPPKGLALVVTKETLTFAPGKKYKNIQKFSGPALMAEPTWKSRAQQALPERKQSACFSV